MQPLNPKLHAGAAGATGGLTVGKAISIIVIAKLFSEETEMVKMAIEYLIEIACMIPLLYLSGYFKKGVATLIVTLAIVFSSGTVDAATLHTTAFNLSWVDIADNETHFEIEIRRGDGTYDKIGQVEANVTKFKAPPVTGAVKSRWCYAVRAVNEIGSSPRAEGCGEIVGSAPSAPLNLLVEPPDPNTLQ